eukprot:jgi/Picsp_1/6803/NSC_04142-R1_peptidylprolyl fkbp-type
MVGGALLVRHQLRALRCKVAHAHTGVRSRAFSTGYEKQIIQEGTGPVPTRGQSVSVHYTGKLTNGQKFDSSFDRNQPLQFQVGVGQVIKGWDEGVLTMKVGEKSVLTCSPDYAYGARGFPPVIPPNSTLVFDVELVSID